MDRHFVFGNEPDIIAVIMIKDTCCVYTNNQFIEDKYPNLKNVLINGIEYSMTSSTLTFKSVSKVGLSIPESSFVKRIAAQVRIDLILCD